MAGTTEIVDWSHCGLLGVLEFKEGKKAPIKGDNTEMI